MTKLLLLLAAASTLQAQRPPQWTLSQRPTLEIGDERNTQTQFDAVSGILRMPGGEIVVANGMSQELRVFSPSGAHLRTLTAGTPGREMRALGPIWRGGDTIYAVEILPAESSVWVFTLGGFVARHGIGAANAGGVYPIGRMADGRYAVSAAPRRQSRTDVGIFVDSTPVGIVSLKDRGPPGWIGWLRNETVVVPGPRGRGARMTEPYRFGRSTSVGVSGDRLWIGDSETGTIAQYSSGGRGLAVFAAPTAPRAIDTAAISRARATVLSSTTNWADGPRAELFHPSPVGRPAPRFTRFLPGVNGDMWLEEFREDLSTPVTFIVVGRTGSPRAWVTVPPTLRLLWVGTSEVLGVRTSSDGQQHIVVHALNGR